MALCKDCVHYEIDIVTAIPFCGLDGNDITPETEACWRFPGYPSVEEGWL